MLQMLWTLGDNTPDEPLEFGAEFIAFDEFLYLSQTAEKAIKFTISPLISFCNY